MQVFGQGLIGSLDVFLHPHYTVSVSPMDFGENGATMSVFLCVMVISWAVYMYLYYWRKNRGKEGSPEDPDTTEKGPP